MTDFKKGDLVLYSLPQDKGYEKGRVAAVLEDGEAIISLPFGDVWVRNPPHVTLVRRKKWWEFWV